jgi:hypothetical protein
MVNSEYTETVTVVVAVSDTELELRVQVLKGDGSPHVSATVPLKPSKGTRVSVRLMVSPSLALALLGLMAIEKSSTVRVTVLLVLELKLLSPE